MIPRLLAWTAGWVTVSFIKMQGTGGKLLLGGGCPGKKPSSWPRCVGDVGDVWLAVVYTALQVGT